LNGVFKWTGETTDHVRGVPTTGGKSRYGVGMTVRTLGLGRWGVGVSK